MLRLGPTTIDLDALVLHGPHGSTPLSAREASLLKYLAQRGGQVVSQAQLLVDVWGYAPRVESRAAYHAVARLRQRLEPDPSQPRYLVTVRGAGFRLVLAPEPEAPSAHLPRRRGRFFGRDQELHALCARLRDELCPVVTVVGLGGVGKTRLAIEALHRVAGHFRATTYCDIGPADDVAAALALVARAIKATGGSPGVAALARRLQGTQLLVLDNVDRLADDLAPQISTLIEAAPGLTVLAVGREALRLRAEARILVEMMHPPTTTALPELKDNAAVQLFVDRISLQDHRFGLNEENAASVSGWIRRTEGWPLALELAASHVAIHGLHAPVEGWSRPGATERDRPARQQTLEQTLAWTWSTIDEPGRDAWRALACFPAGLPQGEAQAHIGTWVPLRQRGLIQTWDAPSGPRIGLLTPAREWAALHQLTEASPGWTMLLDWCVAAARTYARGMATRTGSPGFERLTAEASNLIRAFDVAQRQGRHAAMGWTALGAGIVAWFYGDRGAALVRVEQALAFVTEEPELWHRAGLLASTVAVDGRATRYLEQAVDRADHAPARRRATYLQHLARVYARQGRHQEAHERFERASTQVEPGSRDELSLLANWCGGVVEHDAKLAIEMGARALELCRQHNDRGALPSVLCTVADAHLATGEPEAARRALDEALTLAQQADMPLQAVVCCMLGRSWQEVDDEQAEHWFQHAARLAESFGDLRARSLVHAYLARHWARLGRHAAAEASIQLAEQGPLSERAATQLRRAREQLAAPSRGTSPTPRP